MYFQVQTKAEKDILTMSSVKLQLQDKGNHVGLLELFSCSYLCVHLPADTKQECNVFDEIFLY